jgi:hypothetical protein
MGESLSATWGAVAPAATFVALHVAFEVAAQATLGFSPTSMLAEPILGAIGA